LLSKKRFLLLHPASGITVDIVRCRELFETRMGIRREDVELEFRMPKKKEEKN